MNVNQAVEYLYKKLPMFQKVGNIAYKPGLKNIEYLCHKLLQPHKKFRSIHIAGTNGKGSTSHFLAAVFQAHGYKSGLYTSPHLKKFNERIKINGVEISDAAIAKFVSNHYTSIEETGATFFEATTAMAFDWFAQNKVDIAIIETGLGGRLDATNIITPEISVITNIGFDHMEILGDTLEKIALEKAGIIKPHVPVVISEFQPETAHVFEKKAKECNSKLHFATDIMVQDLGMQANGRAVKIQTGGLLNDYTPAILGLAGRYQLKNVKGVLKTLDVLSQKEWKFTNVNIIKALLEVNSYTSLKGRWQKLNDKPLLICDTAHNEAGIYEVVQQIKATPHEKLWVILGMVKEKKHKEIIKLFPDNAEFVFTQPQVERALAVEKLAELAQELSINGKIIANVNQAITYTMQHALPNDLIYVGGSTFTVADIDML